jgi:hypothetical protein
MKLLSTFKFIDAFYKYINNKIDLKELDSIINSFNFRLIGFRFHKEKMGSFENYILIKSLETDQTFKLNI